MNRSLLSILLLCLASCGSGRAYTLSSSTPASELYSAIESCASQRSFQTNRTEPGVQVRIDPVSLVEYRPGQDGALAMTVAIDDSKIPPADRESKLAAAKSTGDEIFSCAEHKGSGGGPVAAAAAAPAPQASGGKIDWQGNWTAKIAYTWSCKNSMTKPETGSAEGTWMLTFSGAPTALNAHVKASHDGYDLTGAANSGTLRMCGPFPLRGKSTEAGTNDTNICLIADSFSDASHASGHVEGQYVTNVGLDCTVVQGKLDLVQ